MWLYQNKEVSSVEEMPEDTFGFIYEITHIPTGKKYIGKKVLQFNRKLPPLKGQKRKRKVVKESDWKDYYGSHPEFKQIIKEGRKEEFYREILIFVPSKKLLTYYELKFLYQRGVLESDSNEYINDNISGKFFRKDFIY
jgi:hypothetical protein